MGPGSGKLRKGVLTLPLPPRPLLLFTQLPRLQPMLRSSRLLAQYMLLQVWLRPRQDQERIATKQRRLLGICFSVTDGI